MENHNDKTELLELYKLHAELADRVSQRREAANRLFVSLLTGIAIILATSLRFGLGEIRAQVFIITGSALGVVLSVSWFIVIRSYRQLNTGKFAALDELENKLAYPFFRREWEFLEKGEKRNKYWKLTVVETSLPIIFSLFFLSLISALLFLYLLFL